MWHTVECHHSRHSTGRLLYYLPLLPQNTLTENNLLGKWVDFVLQFQVVRDYGEVKAGTQTVNHVTPTVREQNEIMRACPLRLLLLL